MKRQVRSKNRAVSENMWQLRSILAVVLCIVLTYLFYTFLTRNLDSAETTTMTNTLSTLGGAFVAAAILSAAAWWTDLAVGLMVLPVVGYILLDAQNQPLGAIGAFFWLFGVIFAAFLGMAYYARFILPLRGNDGANEALTSMVSYASRDIVPAKLYNVGPSNLPKSFKEFGIGSIPSHEVLALTKGVGFRRGAGPGFVRLSKGETIKESVDLRLQHRTAAVNARTRDGIEVTVMVEILFRIRPLAWDRDPRLPYPYDERSIFDVFYARTLADEQRELAWADRIVPQADNFVVQALSRRTLDSLYQVNMPDADPLGELDDVITDNLKDEFERQGVEIVEVLLGRITVPKEVMDQRVKRWRATWEKRIKTREQAQAGKSIKPMDDETARVQVEVIEELVGNIKMMQQASDLPINAKIAERLLATLEQVAADGMIRALIPTPKKAEEKPKPPAKAADSPDATEGDKPEQA